MQRVSDGHPEGERASTLVMSAMRPSPSHSVLWQSAWLVTDSRSASSLCWRSVMRVEFRSESFRLGYRYAVERAEGGRVRLAVAFSFGAEGIPGQQLILASPNT